MLILLKKIVRASVQKLRALISRYTIPLGAQNQFFARLHYFLVDRTFGREQQAVLAGKFHYQSLMRSRSGNESMLRRNIHRIEKGLVMRPRRIPFARDYIFETVECFVIKMADAQWDPRERKWSTEVLWQYFELHKNVGELHEARDLFFGTARRLQADGTVDPKLGPYKRGCGNTHGVEYQQFLRLAYQRRSVRWFRQCAVERSLIDKAIVVAGLAPSACNRQPYVFRVFDDRDLVAEVVKIPFGLVGYSSNVPVVAVVIGNQRNYSEERDRHLIYIDSALAVMSFCFALETLGLSSCCVNWPDIESHERKMADLLGLDADQRPIMLVACGYPDPDGMIPSSEKKCLDRVRSYNFEN